MLNVRWLYIVYSTASGARLGYARTDQNGQLSAGARPAECSVTVRQETREVLLQDIIIGMIVISAITIAYHEMTAQSMQ